MSNDQYPYKRTDAEAGNPDGWSIPSKVARACEDFVNAQEAFVSNRSQSNKNAYRAASDALVLARRGQRVAERRLGMEIHAQGGRN